MSASPVLVVMGVSGSGKTTLGQALAARLHREFLDADDLHPAENVAKMAAGQPLTDADRTPWLQAVAAWIDGYTPCVVACSALKRSYRDVLRRSELTFVYLAVDQKVADERLQTRSHHFMPASLLDSQLATLEPPGADEAAIEVDAALPTADQVAHVLDFRDHLGARAVFDANS